MQVAQNGHESQKTVTGISHYKNIWTRCEGSMGIYVTDYEISVYRPKVGTHISTSVTYIYIFHEQQVHIFLLHINVDQMFQFNKK